MKDTDKRTVIRLLQSYCDGAAVMTASDFARFLGITKHHASKKLAGLQAYEGRYFLVSDVADLFLREMK